MAVENLETQGTEGEGTQAPDENQEFLSDFEGLEPTEVPENPETKESQSRKEEDVLPEDAEVISNLAEEKVKPIKQNVSEVSKRLDRFDAKEYVDERYDGYTREQKQKVVDTIIKFKNSPAYSNLPISHIGAIVSERHQQRIGARKERAAQAKTASTNTPGTSGGRVTGGDKDWSNASSEEFNARLNQVLNNR